MLLLDALGRAHATIFDGECAPGRRTFDIDTEALGPGVYFIQLRAEGVAALRAIVVR